MWLAWGGGGIGMVTWWHKKASWAGWWYSVKVEEAFAGLSGGRVKFWIISPLNMLPLGSWHVFLWCQFFP